MTGLGSAVLYLAVIFMPSFAKQAMGIDPLIGSAGSTLSAFVIIVGALK